MDIIESKLENRFDCFERKKTKFGRKDTLKTSEFQILRFKVFTGCAA